MQAKFFNLSICEANFSPIFICFLFLFLCLVDVFLPKFGKYNPTSFSFPGVGNRRSFFNIPPSLIKYSPIYCLTRQYFRSTLTVLHRFWVHHNLGAHNKFWQKSKNIFHESTDFLTTTTLMPVVFTENGKVHINRFNSNLVKATTTQNKFLKYPLVTKTWA